MAKAKPDNAAARKQAWAKAAGNSAKSWKSARQAKAGGFADVEIEDGTYPARFISGKADVSKKGMPYVNLKFKVLGDSEMQGLKPSRTDFLQDEDPERQEAKQAGFAKTMAGLGYGVDELELGEVPELMAELNKDCPLVEIYIKNWESDSGKTGYNLYVNRQLTDEEAAEFPDTGDDDDGDGDTVPVKTPPKKKAAPKKKAGSKR
jgi:hypothetical protein